MNRSRWGWILGGVAGLGLVYAVAIHKGSSSQPAQNDVVMLMGPTSKTAHRVIKMEIDIIPHATQRFDSPGDWYYEDGTLKIMVSYLGDSKEDLQKEALIVAHEMMDLMLYKKAGVGKGQADNSGPLKRPDHPYWEQTTFAKTVERLLASYLGVPWKSYVDSINSLHWNAKPKAP